MKTLALVALLAAGAALPARAENLGTLNASWPARDLQRVRVEFPVGDLEIVAGETSDVRAQLTVYCRGGGRHCRERSKHLKIVSHESGHARSIKLEGYPRFRNLGLQVKLRVEVPRDVAVALEMGVGDLSIDGVQGDLSAELGVGDVNVSLHERDVRAVNLEVGIGDATLDHGAHRQSVSGLFGRKVRWSDGVGRSRVNVELGIGDISMRLD
jgi:hypothetical protein